MPRCSLRNWRRKSSSEVSANAVSGSRSQEKGSWQLGDADQRREDRTMTNATECAGKAGKYAFGLDETRTAAALRKLADDIEAGTVALHSVTTSIHAAH